MIKQDLFLIDSVFPKLEKRIFVFLKDAILVLGFALLTGISAQIKIEIGIIPITFQTLIVLLSGFSLGKIKGALSQITYVALGLMGLPIFTHGGGPIYFLSPTFGYLIGFILAAFVTGWIREKGFGKKIFTAFLAMLIGNLVLYIPGLLWLAQFVGFSKVLIIGFYPFIFADLIKIILAGLFLSLGWSLINQFKNLNNVSR